MKVLFLVIWGFILLAPQLAIRFYIFGTPLGLNLSTLLVIYIGFRYPFFSGLLGVVVISFMAETFSLVSHGTLILAHLILFAGQRLLSDRIFTEAYLTKSMWVFFFSFLGYGLIRFALEPQGFYLGQGSFWLEGFFQSFIDAIVSFPLFIVLDATLEKWTRVTARKQASLTGAYFFQSKSGQRRYF